MARSRRLQACPAGPGGIFGPGGPGVGPVTGEDLKKCLNDPNSCASVVVSGFAYSVVAPIVDQYISYLQSQAAGKWQSLPESVISVIAPKYPDINLHAIRYATEIDTVHKQHITLGNEIFFVTKMDFNNVAGVCLLAHELEHSVQASKRGGVRPFLAEYIAKGAGKIIEKKSIDVHDDIDLEKDAIQKSKSVIELYGYKNIEHCVIPSITVSTATGGFALTITKDDTDKTERLVKATGQEFDGWMALHDVGATASFFNKGGHPINASNINIGDILITNRDVNLRKEAADWSAASVVAKNKVVHIVNLRSLSAGPNQTQLWAQVDVR